MNVTFYNSLSSTEVYEYVDCHLHELALSCLSRTLKCDGHDDWQQQNALIEKQTKLKSNIEQLKQVIVKEFPSIENIVLFVDENFSRQ